MIFFFIDILTEMKAHHRPEKYATPNVPTMHLQQYATVCNNGNSKRSCSFFSIPQIVFCPLPRLQFAAIRAWEHLPAARKEGLWAGWRGPRGSSGGGGEDLESCRVLFFLCCFLLLGRGVYYFMVFGCRVC